MYMKLFLNLTKWFLKKKLCISTHRSQERPFSFLKGKNGDTKDTGQYLTIQDSENVHEASLGSYKIIPDE